MACPSGSDDADYTPYLTKLDEYLADDPADSKIGSGSTSPFCSPKTKNAPEAAQQRSVAIDSLLHYNLVNGIKDFILAMETKLWEFKSVDNGNSVLHIAASAGQAELITDILPHCKGLISSNNYKGDLAFHSAAKAGQVNALIALTKWERYDESECITKDILATANESKDTALHIAVRNNQLDMAYRLFTEYKPACYALNDDNVCPLYLAIEARYYQLAKDMISYTKDRPDAEECILKGKSVIHAAIDAKNREILEDILRYHEKLIESFDYKGRTPLSYAAFTAYTKGVQCLLKKFPHCSCKCDVDGSFPIHQAAKGGNVEVIKKLKNSIELLNKNSQNILHVAAGNGKSEVVSYLLEVKELERLINLKDEDGNTPLHLAAKGFHPRVVHMLARNKNIKLGMKNNDGLTALDVVEINAGSTSPFEERLTWLALRYVAAPRASQEIRKDFAQKEKLWKEGQRTTETKNRKLSKKTIEKNESDNFKDRIDTNLLVATLIATVTFAAGFTVPGGLNQSNPHIGLAVLAHKWAFQVFVICNNAAMYSSIMVVVILIWAQLGELKLSVASYKFALPILGFALSMMTLAFMMGTFVVLRNLQWLSYVALGMGSIYLIVVIVLFFPQYNPSYIKNSILRFIFTGPYLLLLVVSEKCKPRYV